MSRNKEKQKNALNRLYLSKSEKPKVKRPPLSQIHTVDELRRWLPTIEREIHMTLAQTKSVRYTDAKVESMYKQITELENEHKSFRRKIAQLELGPHVNVLTTTVPIEKSIDCYMKKTVTPHIQETLDDVFKKSTDLPLLSMHQYKIELSMLNKDQPMSNTNLVDYPDSD